MWNIIDVQSEWYSFASYAKAADGIWYEIFVHHDDVITWKHFPRYWPFVRGIHRSPVNSPHKGQWRGALMFSLNCVWINSWVNNREAGDLRRYRAHYDVIVIIVIQIKIYIAAKPCDQILGYSLKSDQSNMQITTIRYTNS